MLAVGCQPDAGDKAHDFYSPPPCGEGSGVGVPQTPTLQLTPLPDPPPQGGREKRRRAMAIFIMPRSSIRLRQAQHLLGDKAENELRADGRDARDQGFTQVTLDVKLLGIAEAAMRHDRLLARLKAGFTGEIF